MPKPELPKELADVVNDLIVALFRVPFGGTSSKILSRELERAIELYGVEYDMTFHKRSYDTYKLIIAYAGKYVMEELKK